MKYLVSEYKNMSSIIRFLCTRLVLSSVIHNRGVLLSVIVTCIVLFANIHSCWQFKNTFELWSQTGISKSILCENQWSL
jgi:hypothetical protein